MQPISQWHLSSQPVRFFFVDWRACVAFLAVYLFPRWETLIPALVVMGILYLAERKGIDYGQALRWMRSKTAGPVRISFPYWRN